ncbi:MAG: exodeoxyribonuclease VII small subunit [Bacteroidales bacterium]|nr:exodeoxyribonuclease VII small subunit [Bacteroidales bacterium]
MKKEEFSYDKAMADLEKIVQKIESGDCKIDELTAEIKKAAELISLCKKKLQNVDAEVNKIFGELED